MIDFELISGFDWDEGNISKSLIKHKVQTSEAEQVFSNEPLLLLHDDRHSEQEKRYNAMGKTNAGRLLFLAFSLRDDETKIRIISARPMNKNERRLYEQS